MKDPKEVCLTQSSVFVHVYLALLRKNSTQKNSTPSMSLGAAAHAHGGANPMPMMGPGGGMGMGGGGGIGGGPGGGFEGPSTSSGGGGCCGDVCLPEHVGAVPLDGEIQRGDLTGDRYGRYGRQEQGQEWCMCVFDVYVESIDLSSIPSPPSALCLHH